MTLVFDDEDEQADGETANVVPGVLSKKQYLARQVRGMARGIKQRGGQATVGPVQLAAL